MPVEPRLEPVDGRSHASRSPEYYDLVCGEARCAWRESVEMVLSLSPITTLLRLRLRPANPPPQGVMTRGGLGAPRLTRKTPCKVEPQRPPVGERLYQGPGRIGNPPSERKWRGATAEPASQAKDISYACGEIDFLIAQACVIAQDPPVRQLSWVAKAVRNA